MARTVGPTEYLAGSFVAAAAQEGLVLMPVLVLLLWVAVARTVNLPIMPCQLLILLCSGNNHGAIVSMCWLAVDVFLGTCLLHH